MLQTVVENLVENAIRYAGEGATCVISLGREDGAIVLEASDDGAGIPAEDVARLFERFFRSDRARTTRGSGLGLAIVKHVVETAAGTSKPAAPPAAGSTCVVPSLARYLLRLASDVDLGPSGLPWMPVEPSHRPWASARNWPRTPWARAAAYVWPFVTAQLMNVLQVSSLRRLQGNDHPGERADRVGASRCFAVGSTTEIALSLRVTFLTRGRRRLERLDAREDELPARGS